VTAPAPIPEPVAVVGGLYFKQLTAGFGDRTCGKTDTSVGYCCGGLAMMDASR
jgi:hypothetical protein